MTSLLEPVIKELSTVIQELTIVLRRVTESLDHKKSEVVAKQTPHIEKLSNPIIPPQSQKVTAEQVRELLTTKRAEGKMEPMLKLMQTKYSATKFSELDKEKYAEFLRDAEDI
ncbi:hypothetical protein DEAC_c23260 [Desulfosporosinus acididurans]|uniref:rRNA biogenesis protein rrp5 n=1 Tax=Desulfosporosinus acididurans TaxID=476652 RepID=A0A0J1ILW3_9FIRM|nr:hypothetical protein DEAC_c23260 [Desulfosporosinus acididurans]